MANRVSRGDPPNRCRRGGWLLPALVVAVCAVAVIAADGPSDPPIQTTRADSPARLRRPVALVLLDDGKSLLAANRRGGSVSVIDTGSSRVVEELDVGGKLADLAALPDGRHLLAVDEQRHRLVVLRRDGRGLEVAARIPVAHTPVGVVVSKDGRRAYVASLWSRRVSVVDLSSLAGEDTKDGKDEDTAAGVHVTAVVRLPFAPRKQLLVQGDKTLLVADSFAGRLAIIDTAAGKLSAVRELPAHHIRGLALSGDGKKLLVAHQTINSLAVTDHNDVHWGVLMTNDLRWLVLDTVLDPRREILQGSHGHPLGDATAASGEPGEVAVAPDGRVLVALSGVSEVAVGREDDFGLDRQRVGRRPTDVVVSPDGRRAYLANTFSDSISVVDLGEQKVSGEIPLGAAAKLTAADRGELLFHDARLSLDGWFSCNGCHVDGHTNGQLNDNLGDDSFGAPKRIVSLLGVGQTGPWAWSGKRDKLDVQIHKSVVGTLQGPRPTGGQLADLTAYLHTLRPPPSLAATTGEVDLKSAARGKLVFARQECGACHAPPHYTTPEVYDVGLADKRGNTEFNPPSLLGVSQGGPYFHDNSAATLDEVFTRHRHQLDGNVPAEDVLDLVNFLRTL